jgi:uncharacterized protein (TIGR03437 family)
VKVVDDCGVPTTSGSVVVSFGNGDPPLSLVSLQDGSWANSWQPRNSNNNSVLVSVDAEVPAANLKGTTSTSIGLQGSKTLPVLSGGPLSGVTLAEGPLAPGDLILLKGTALANSAGSSTGSPSQQLGGTSVLIGGRLAPLLYADSTQVLGLIPTDLLVNSSQVVLVQRDNSPGVPAPIIIASSHPSVLTKDGSGRGQGLIYRASGNAATTLADASNPVQPGDTILIYCAGLGATGPDGGASNPPAVLINGQSAQVNYAGVALPTSYPPAGAPNLLGGLTSAGLGGLYQIAVVVPGGVTNGDTSIVVNAAGQSSQEGVTFAITGGTDNVPTTTPGDTRGGFRGHRPQ